MAMFESLPAGGGGELTMETMTSPYSVTKNLKNAIIIVNYSAYAIQSSAANKAALTVKLNGTNIYSNSGAPTSSGNKTNLRCQIQRDLSSGDSITWSTSGSGVVWSSAFARLIYVG